MEFGRLARSAGVSPNDGFHRLLLALDQHADFAFRVSYSGQDARPPFTPGHTRRTPSGRGRTPLLLNRPPFTGHRLPITGYRARRAGDSVALPGCSTPEKKRKRE